MDKSIGVDSSCFDVFLLFFYCSYFPGKRYCHRRRSLCFSSVEKVLVGKEVVRGFGRFSRFSRCGRVCRCDWFWIIDFKNILLCVTLTGCLNCRWV